MAGVKGRSGRKPVFRLGRWVTFTIPGDDFFDLLRLRSQTGKRGSLRVRGAVRHALDSKSTGE